MMDAQTLAIKLKGEVVGRDSVIAPGPGHSPVDRSLSVRLTGGEKFVVHSFAGDSWQQCRDHVRESMGRPTFASCHRAVSRTASRNAIDNTELALRIWRASRSP